MKKQAGIPGPEKGEVNPSNKGKDTPESHLGAPGDKKRSGGPQTARSVGVNPRLKGKGGYAKSTGSA